MINVTVVIPRDQLTTTMDPSAIAQAPLEWTNVLANVVHLSPADTIDTDATVRYECTDADDARRIADQARSFSWTVYE